MGDQRHMQDFLHGYTLGYGRYGDTWRLLVHQDEHITGDTNSEEWIRVEIKPLLDWRCHIRIEAARAIPALLEEIAAEAKRKIEQMQKVTDH